MGDMTSEEKKEFYGHINKLNKSVDRILFLLESDSRTNNKGLVETVQDNKKVIDTMLLERKIENAKNSVWGIVGGAIVTGCYALLNYFLSK